MANGKVLIVEDDPDVGNLLLQIAQLRDYDGKWVDTSRGALALVPDYRPDLVILDVMLPDVDGLRTCRSLRDCEQGNAMGILILTCLTGDRYRAEAFANGADRFLNKPVQPDNLLDEMDHVLAHVRGDRRAIPREEVAGSFQTDTKSPSALSRLNGSLLKSTPLREREIVDCCAALGRLGEFLHEFRPDQPARWRCRVFADHVEYEIIGPDGDHWQRQVGDQLQPPLADPESFHAVAGNRISFSRSINIE